jgi:hypothetical protein
MLDQRVGYKYTYGIRLYPYVEAEGYPHFHKKKMRLYPACPNHDLMVRVWYKVLLVLP